MKIAVFGESTADESALYILVEALLGTQIEQIPVHLLVREGWTHVFKNIAAVIKHLSYNTDTDGLIVVVDSDSTPVHTEDHEKLDGLHVKCRICQLESRMIEVQKSLTPVPNRSPLKIAIGLAVPAIEAWYLCGNDAQSTEAILTKRKDTGTSSLRNELKRRVYNPGLPLQSFRMPSLAFQTECAVKEAKRLASDIEQLKTFFPNGFGKLVRDISNW
jgi:hypothetical protein